MVQRDAVMELGMQISRSIEPAMLPCVPYVPITTEIHSTEPSPNRQMVRQLMEKVKSEERD